MHPWYLLLRQVSKSDNPENPEILKSWFRQQCADKAPNQRQIRVWYLCLHCGRETYPPPDLLSALKTPPTSIYGTKLTPMVRFHEV